MKLLVLLAVLGAASAQYKLYTGVSPYLHHAAYSPVTYAASPLTYAASPVAYSAYPYSFYGLPYAFKPAEKAAEAEKPVQVESRSKRSADEDQKADDALLHYTYAAQPYASYPLTYSHAAYTPAVYTSGYAYNGYQLPYAYSGYHGYSPIVHSLKKRDTAAADQKADDTLLVNTYAAHPYTAGYPAYRSYAYAPTVYSAYSATYNTPASTAPLTYTAGFPYTYVY